MANKKITDLVDIGTPASGDLLEIVDISEGVSKRVAVSALGGGSTPTLQEVLDNNHDLVDGNFFVGTLAGDNNVGTYVIGIGDSALRDNTTDYIVAIGSEAGFENTGAGLNALGVGAGYQNSGDNVVAIGLGAGIFNTYNYVNLFGTNATADENGQTVLSKDDTIMARISTIDLTDTRKYNLPDADGTLALTTDIPPAITIDATPTDGSANAVSSNGVFDALALKADLANVEQIIRSKSNGTFGSHTGDIAETVIQVIDIDANEFVAGDWMTLLFSGEKDATVGNVTWRLRAGVNGNTSDAQIAILTATAANSRYSALYRGRPQFLTGNQLRIWNTSSTSSTDISVSGAPTLFSLTPTSAWKLTLTAQLTVLTETASLTGYRIGKIKSF